MCNPESVFGTLGKIYNECKSTGKLIKIKFLKPETEEDKHIEHLIEAAHIVWHDKANKIICLTKKGMDFFEELDYPDSSSKFSTLSKEGFRYSQASARILEAANKRKQHGWMST